MKNEKQVYALEASVEAHRPKIDFARDVEPGDVVSSVEVLEGKSGIDNWPQPHFRVGASDALEWDYYFGSSLSDLISLKARDVFEPIAKDHIKFLPVYINAAPYFCMKIINTLDCLDLQKSIIEYYDDLPKVISRIEKYVFRKELMDDPLIFAIPDVGPIIFATESVKSISSDAGLKGIDFVCPDEPF